MTKENETSSTEEVTSVRAWLRGKAKVIGLYGTAVAGVLGALVAWNQLDGPRPALISDVDERVLIVQRQIIEAEKRINRQLSGLEKFNYGTRKLVLGQEWERLDRQIRQLVRKTNRTADDETLLSKLKNRKRVVEQQLRLLEGG